MKKLKFLSHIWSHVSWSSVLLLCGHEGFSARCSHMGGDERAMRGCICLCCSFVFCSLECVRCEAVIVCFVDLAWACASAAHWSSGCRSENTAQDCSTWHEHAVRLHQEACSGRRRANTEPGQRGARGTARRSAEGYLSLRQGQASVYTSTSFETLLMLMQTVSQSSLTHTSTYQQCLLALPVRRSARGEVQASLSIVVLAHTAVLR